MQERNLCSQGIFFRLPTSDFPPSSCAPGVSLAPKTSFPFPFKRPPRRLEEALRRGVLDILTKYLAALLVKGEAMASFLKTGGHYYKSLDVLKKKSDQFVQNIGTLRSHMVSAIQRLPQHRSCLNILSVGSGTGKEDVEILKIVKEELQRTQGRDQTMIYNRAIELNEYACDLYKASVKMLNDQHIAVDVRCQGFEEYKERGAKEPEERTRFDVIHFTHSIYYLDIKESLSHCIENELNANGSLFVMVGGPDLICLVLDKQRFPDWYGKSNGSVPESYNAVEKILKFVEEGGWKHEVFSHEYPIDVTDVFDPESTEGNLLLDFLTHSKNFRGTADEEVVNETLALIKDLSTIKDGRHFGKLTEYLIFIYK